MAWDNQGLKLYREVECDDGELEVTDFNPAVLMAPRQLDLFIFSTLLNDWR